MHSTRPRHSILTLFDPLAAPPRDAPSPDSDKENSSSLAFLPRPPKHPSPVVLTRRLIDVGDVTFDDPSMVGMLTDEDQLECAGDEDDDTRTFVLPATTPARLHNPILPSATARSPLGELLIERDTPLARSKIFKRPPVSALATSDPVTSPLSPVSPTLNILPTTFSSPDLASRSTPTETPEIVISSSDSPIDSSFNFNIESPATPPSLATPPSESLLSPSPNLRPQAGKSSSRALNRCSIDLQASFQLHLQSEDTSFDLLNDKISFFTAANGMDSFLHAMDEDDSFDMAVEEANLEKALERIKLDEKEEKARVQKMKISIPTKEAVSVIPLDEPETPHETAATPATSSPTPAINPVLRHKPSLLRKRSSLGSKPNSPVASSFLFGRPKDTTIPPLPTKPLVISSSSDGPPSGEESVVTSLEPAFATPSVSRSAPKLPKPAVAALRIVKRATRLTQEKPASSDFTTSRIERSLSGVRQAPPSNTTGSRPGVGPSRIFTATPLTTTVTGPGPRRVLVTESQSSTMNINSGMPKMASANPSGPRRVPVSVPAVPVATATASAALPKPASVTTGLRAPSKFAKATGVPTLPRSGGASRLPAPSTSRVVGLGGQGVPPRRVV